MLVVETIVRPPYEYRRSSKAPRPRLQPPRPASGALCLFIVLHMFTYLLPIHFITFSYVINYICIYIYIYIYTYTTTTHNIYIYIYIYIYSICVYIYMYSIYTYIYIYIYISIIHTFNYRASTASSVSSRGRASETFQARRAKTILIYSDGDIYKFRRTYNNPY